jgi:hypothetical protein
LAEKDSNITPLAAPTSFQQCIIKAFINNSLDVKKLEEGGLMMVPRKHDNTSTTLKQEVSESARI